MDLSTLLILILATWRLSSLLVNEAGPLDMFDRLRHLAGVRQNEYGVIYAANVAGRALTCVWCTSVWTGLGVFLFWWYVPYGLWLLVPLALSGGAIIVEEVISG